MADRGVVNNRKGSVTFTVEMDGGRRDIVLKPGANRLTGAQYDALSKNKVFRDMFKHTDAVERMTVPDAKNPGEMTVQETKKRLPPKFRSEDPGNLDAAETKDHTGGKGDQQQGGAQPAQGSGKGK